MTFPYTVRKGDFLSAIAKKFGIKTWQEIYRHPENADFRAKRPNPNLIFPGDIVRIPVTFTAVTTSLATTPPSTVLVNPQNPNMITTQSTVAQFRWSAAVTMRPVGGDFEVGFIQNVVEFQAEWLYKRDGVDPSPKRVLITLKSLPCLDNKKGTVTVWSKDRAIHMGALPLKDPPPEPPLEDTGQIATDDTPGGQIPLIHPKDPTRKLTSIIEHMKLMTWIAVRPSDSPERMVDSYEFLQNVSWGFDREVSIQSHTPFQASFTKNKMSSLPGNGIGLVPGTPELNPPLARDLVQFTFV
jgi:hypothetical protein